MKILRCLFLSIAIFSLSKANSYSIVLFSTKIIYPKDKQLFILRFSKGSIKKLKGYYVFKIDDIDSYTKAKKKLRKAKKYYKDAFIVKENTPITPISLNEPKISKKLIPNLFTNIKISETSPKPKLNEPKILENWQIPNKYKTTNTNTYDILNFTKYINAVFNYNDNAKEAYYQKKIDYIVSKIKKDKYGFDIYAKAYAGTGRSISTNANNIVGNGGYTNAGISLNANKLIYDGEYTLRNQTYDILYRRLSQIKEINAKEKLILIATSIYINMYVAQEEIDMYKKILQKQAFIKKIVKAKYKHGKASVLDFINAKDDYINLQIDFLNAKYQYLYNDYILRQSIKSRSKKPFKLYPVKIKINTNSLKILQKEAIKQSSDIAIESNLLKLKEVNYMADIRRYYPVVNFTSNVGYGISNENYFNLSNAGKGAFWTLELTAKIPLYNRKDIILSKERDIYDILKQKRVLSLKQREILTQLNKTYNETKRMEKQKKFLFELLSLSKRRLEIIKERYVNGLSTYKQYSDALTKYLKYKNQLISTEQNYIKESSLLSILIGKKKFYE